MISKHEFIFRGTRIPYWQKGDSPRLLIVSGAHGDEHGVVPIVSREIEKQASALRDFIYIPELSPSAMRRKTRLNENGEDIERGFYEGSPHTEAHAIMEFLRGRTFDLCVSFHEDKEWNGFYLYDIAQKLNMQGFAPLCESLVRRGLSLHTGGDDREDPLLRHRVENGYVYIPIDRTLIKQPFFGSWLVKHAIVSRILVPEVPMRLSREEKMHVVSACFDYIAECTAGAGR